MFLYGNRDEEKIITIIFKRGVNVRKNKILNRIISLLMCVMLISSISNHVVFAASDMGMSYNDMAYEDVSINSEDLFATPNDAADCKNCWEAKNNGEDNRQTGIVQLFKEMQVSDFNPAGIVVEIYGKSDCTGNKIAEGVLSYDGNFYGDEERPLVYYSGSVDAKCMDFTLAEGVYYYKLSEKLYQSDTDFHFTGYEYTDKIAAFSVSAGDNKRIGLDETLFNGKKIKSSADVKNHHEDNRAEESNEITEDALTDDGETGPAAAPGDVERIATAGDVVGNAVYSKVLNLKDGIMKSLMDIARAADTFSVNVRGRVSYGDTYSPEFYVKELGVYAYCGDAELEAPAYGDHSYAYSVNPNAAWLNEVRGIIAYGETLDLSDRNYLGLMRAIHNVRHHDTNTLGTEYQALADDWVNQNVLDKKFVSVAESEIRFTYKGKNYSNKTVTADADGVGAAAGRRVTDEIVLKGSADNYITVRLPSGLWLKVGNTWYQSGSVKVPCNSTIKFSVAADDKKTYKLPNLDGLLGCDVYCMGTGGGMQDLLCGKTNQDTVSFTIKNTVEDTHYYLWMTKKSADGVSAAKAGAGITTPYNAAGITYQVCDSAGSQAGRFYCSFNGYCYADRNDNPIIFKSRGELDMWKAANGEPHTQFVEVDKTGTYTATELENLRMISENKITMGGKLEAASGLLHNDKIYSVTVTKDNTDKNTSSNKAAAYLEATDKGYRDIRLKKVDASDNHAVKDAVYGLYRGSAGNRNNYICQFKTDNDGYGVIQNLADSNGLYKKVNSTTLRVPVGTYWAEEIESPEEYALNTTPIVKTFSGADTTLDFTFTGKDARVKYSMSLTKKLNEKFKNCNLSLEGAQYTVYKVANTSDKSTTKPVAVFTMDKNGIGKADDVKVVDGNMANGNGTSTLGNLEYGVYRIDETKVPEGLVKAAPFYVDFTKQANQSRTEQYSISYSQNKAACISFEDALNDPINITMYKSDADGNKNPAGAASLEGAQFTIKFYAGVLVDNVEGLMPTDTWVVETKIDSNSLVGTRLYKDFVVSHTGSTEYDVRGQVNLTIGTITIEETKAPDGYNTAKDGGRITDDAGTEVNPSMVILQNKLNDKGELGLYAGSKNTAGVRVFNTLQKDAITVYEPVKRADIKFKKVDEKGKPMAGVVFSITSKTTGEKHLVVTDSNGIFDSSKLQNTNNTNQNDGNAKDAANGVWFFGSNDNTVWNYDKVSDGKGAFAFDTYVIEELPCDANKGRQLIDAVEVVVSEGGKVFDVGENLVNVPEPRITTKAYNTETGLKTINKKKSVSITDEVKYEYFEAGATYTIKGIVMNADGTPYKNGTVTAEKVFTTNTATNRADKYSASGTEKLVFSFDATDATGSLVVYEYVYKGESKGAVHTNGSAIDTTGVLTDREGNLVCHADKTDAEQTVTVAELKTKAWLSSTGINQGQASKETEVLDKIMYKGLTPGTKYSIKSEVVYNDGSKNTVIASREENYTPTVANGEMTVKFDKFDSTPYAGKSFTVFETITLDGVTVMEEKTIGEPKQTVHLITIGTTAMDKETKAHVSCADNSVTIVDTVHYANLIIGKEYTVEGTLVNRKTAEPLVDAQGREVTGSVTFTADKKNGSVEVVFEFDASLLAGETTVAFETLKHDGVEVAYHKDLTDDDQTIYFPKIGTAARAEDDSKELAFNKKVTIVDTIKYENLTVGEGYVAYGIVMNKATGKTVTVNGREVTAEVRFTPDKKTGSVDVVFTLDTTGLEDATLVVFERVALESNGEVIGLHEDLEDEDQTVYIPGKPDKPNVPKTGDCSKVLCAGVLGTLALVALALVLTVRRRINK